MNKIPYWILLLTVCLSITGCAFTQEGRTKRNGELTEKWSKKIKILIPAGTSKQKAIDILTKKGYEVGYLGGLSATKTLFGGHTISISFNLDQDLTVTDSFVTVGSSSHL